MSPSRYWSDLSTADFAALDMETLVAVQPVTAIEQNGPHLPVSVDAAINAGIVAKALQRLPRSVPALVLPPLVAGKSDEHLAFPGTLSLSYETLGRVWFEIAESVKRAGCRRIVFFNSHGGQPQLVDIVCREVRVRLEMFAVASTWFQFTDVSDLFDAAECTHGIHAGAIETSVMLHLHPELVRMDRAEDCLSVSAAVAAENSVLRSEGMTGFGWQMQDLHPSGVAGNAAAASPELGRTIVERAGERLALLIAETARYPLSNLVRESQFSRGRDFSIRRMGMS